MRTLILLCFVALIVGVGIAFAYGLIAVTSEHRDGDYVVALTIHANAIAADVRSHEPFQSSNETAHVVTGAITAVNAEQNTFTVTNDGKDWTFHLDKDGVILSNDRPSNLAQLRVGEEASVHYDRDGTQMFATFVRAGK